MEIPVLLLVSSCFVLSAAGTGDNRNLITDFDDGIAPRSFHMVVEVRPSGGWYRVQCYSRTGSTDRDSGAVYEPVTLAWDFIAGASTKFWCQASRYDGKIIPTFPVFGDLVPRTSSLWQVNSEGKIRLRENSRSTNDYQGPWH